MFIVFSFVVKVVAPHREPLWTAYCSCWDGLISIYLIELSIRLTLPTDHVACCICARYIPSAHNMIEVWRWRWFSCSSAKKSITAFIFEMGHAPAKENRDRKLISIESVSVGYRLKSWANVVLRIRRSGLVTFVRVVYFRMDPYSNYLRHRLHLLVHTIFVLDPRRYRPGESPRKHNTE